MDKTRLSLLLVLLGTTLFNFLFWKEDMGLNTLIFSTFYLTSLLWLFPESRSNPAFWASGGGLLLASVMVVWHHSTAANFAFLTAFACAAGFAQMRELRFVLHAALQYVLSWIYPPKKLVQGLSGSSNWTKSILQLRRRVGVGCLPMLIAFVFYGLYYLANDKFAALADGFWRGLGRFFSFDISIWHLLFVVFGFFVVGAAFWQTRTDIVPETAPPDFIQRVRPPKGRLLEPPEMLGLSREHRQSVFLLVLLNALLLIVNLTDIRYVWFGFDATVAADLKGYVHEGTYFLIASILLAMCVLFYVFRKNLNFYPKNDFLKKNALIWLIQNGILAFSVALRNARYIEFHGLAYKRIGVFLFLALVFFGLFTLWKKIRERRSFFWLWVQNGWAVFALLMANACVPWDTVITRYNLFGPVKSTIDVDFLLHTVSDKNLYLLEQNLELLKQKPSYPELADEAIEAAINSKRVRFEHRFGRAGQTWKSWNAADARNRSEN